MNQLLAHNVERLHKSFKYKRLFIPLTLLLLLTVDSLRPIILQSLSDAFLQVTVFVAATLCIYYFLLERFPMLDLSYVRKNHPHLEIPVAALLGALPGCGGAIIVVTQFTKRQASFGSIVAVLTATMGDAAFLLLATRPLDGVIILSMGLAVGIISGVIVNRIHSPSYLQPEKSTSGDITPDNSPNTQQRAGRVFWRIWMLPSLFIGFLLAGQFDFDRIIPNLNQYIMYFGALGALVVTVLWAVSSKGENYQDMLSEDETPQPYSKFNKVMQDTHFVTAWVVTAFVLYEVAVNLLELDLGAWFAHYAVLAPLVGLVIGLLPGCGPQILVTTLYIQGIVPFSALAANAISNDGDALFPAIALAPKAAMVATLYSAIPALFVGYSIYWINGT